MAQTVSDKSAVIANAIVATKVLGEKDPQAASNASLLLVALVMIDEQVGSVVEEFKADSANSRTIDNTLLPGRVAEQACGERLGMAKAEAMEIANHAATRRADREEELVAASSEEAPSRGPTIHRAPPPVGWDKIDG